MGGVKEEGTGREWLRRKGYRKGVVEGERVQEGCGREEGGGDERVPPSITHLLDASKFTLSFFSF